VPVQVRLRNAFTSDEYISQQVWRTASLPECPFGREPCRAVGHGSYGRRRPPGLRIARERCKPCGVTIGLLPDFAASRVSGTLDEFEDAAVAAAAGRSLWSVANEVRPYEGVLQSAVRWVRLRAQVVHELLRSAVGLVPALMGCEPTLAAVRERLGLQAGVLRRLRDLCEQHLWALCTPLGLCPRPQAVSERKRRRPQSTGPDPPPEDR